MYFARLKFNTWDWPHRYWKCQDAKKRMELQLEGSRSRTAATVPNAKVTKAKMVFLKPRSLDHSAEVKSMMGLSRRN